MSFDKAKEIIKEFEGYREKAYQCSANVWTIGFGSTVYPSGIKVKQNDTTNSSEAELLLDLSIANLSQRISDLCHPVKLTDNQLAGLISFVYNIGIGAFKKSTMLKLILAKKPMMAAAEFLRWNKANGKVLNGLAKRRAKERELFLS